jgi:DNA-binding transcriptional MerR regulator
MRRTTTVVVTTGRVSDLLTIEEVAARCDIHPTLVRHLYSLGLIDCAAETTERFPPDVTLRLQRMLRLRRDLGLTYAAAGLVVDLLERIETLEARLHHFEGSS